MTENELKINGKSFSETISQIEEFMESDDVHGELFTVLRSARDFMENLNEEIQQYREIAKNKHIGKDNMVISSSDLMTILNSDSEKEIRAKAIDEFAERIKRFVDCGHLCSPTEVRWSDLSIVEMIDRIAEQLKGGAV